MKVLFTRLDPVAKKKTEQEAQLPRR